MIFQRIRWIIGTADYLDIHFPEQTDRRIFGSTENFRGSIKNFIGVVLIQQFVDSKIAFHLHVSPVVQWIPHRIRNTSGPGAKLFTWLGSAGNQIFVNAQGPHSTPFVMIPFQPGLGYIIVYPLLINFRWWQMVVIIDDWHMLGVIKIQLLGIPVAKYKILFIKFSHDAVFFHRVYRHFLTQNRY